MNRQLRMSVLIVTVAALAACSPAAPADAPSASATAAPSATPTDGPSVTPAPTGTRSASPGGTTSPGQPSSEPPADPATVLAADGIGPYVVGASLADLQSSGLVTNVAASINCDAAWQVADATGRHAGTLSVTFHEGRLIDVATQSPELVTPSGARVGMPLTQLQRTYGSRGTLIEGVSGNLAFTVRVPETPLGVVFYLDQTNTLAASMSAAVVERLEQAAEFGEGC